MPFEYILRTFISNIIVETEHLCVIIIVCHFNVVAGTCKNLKPNNHIKLTF